MEISSVGAEILYADWRTENKGTASRGKDNILFSQFCEFS